jgi:hypothetical protein
MNEEQVLKLLITLSDNDCLHPDWEWQNEDKDGNLSINEDSLWIVDEINKILIQK